VFGTIIIIDDGILDALDKQSFSSFQEFAKLTCIPKTTVPRHLTSSLGFGVKNLHWVPHGLTEAQKARRVTLSNHLLRDLRSINHQGWQFMITLDESWFPFAPDHGQIWP
jgi:hypothetical protein